jgi:hypothetical protein
MTVGIFLHAAPLVLWALFLGMTLASTRSNAGRRRIATILVSIWLVFTAVRLWEEPVIEPLWMQYLLLALLPALAGFGAALLAQHCRYRRSDPPTEHPTTEEGVR